MDANGLAACASHVEGMPKLSKERLGSEMSKLLAAPDPAPTLAAMAASGVLAQVLPGADPVFLAPLVHIEGDRAPRWQRRLSVIGGSDVPKMLRLSKANTRYLSDIKQVLRSDKSNAVNAYLFGMDETLDAKLVEAASLTLPLPDDLDAQIALGARAKFPLKAADLFEWFEKGPALGVELKRLEAAWLDSEFTPCVTVSQLIQPPP